MKRPLLFKITVVKLRCISKFIVYNCNNFIIISCSDEDDDEENDAKDFIAKDEDAR